MKVVAWSLVPVLFLEYGQSLIAILPPQRMVTCTQKKHLSLNFRLAYLHILRILLSVFSWSLPMSSNPAIRIHPQCQTCLTTPGTTYLFFSETHLQCVLHQMAVICTSIYQMDKKKLLSMIIVHLALSCGTLSFCQ